MNFNVERLWNQVLVQPEEVLKLIPSNSNNKVLHLLFILAERVLLETNKIRVNACNYKKNKIEGTTIANLFLIECFKRSKQLENKIYQDQPKLVGCFDNWQKKMKTEKHSQLIDLASYLKDEKMDFLKTKQLFHLFFLDCVAVDLIKLMSQSIVAQKQFQQYFQQHKQIKIQQIETQHILKVLKVSVPSVLSLIVLKQSQLPFSLRKHTKSLLYLQKSLHWILKKSTKLACLNKLLIEVLIAKQSLSFSQQLNLARIVFRYFYAYHQQRKMMAVQILFETFNKIDGAVRFALASQFAVLLKIAEKIGKNKMVQAMTKKSKWIQELKEKKSCSQSRLNQQNQSQESVYGQNIILKPNQNQILYFEVVEDYTIGCFNISCESEFQVQITRVNDFEGREFQEDIIKNQKTKRFNERIVFEKKGICKVSLSNYISWIATKKINYHLKLLSPVQLEQKNSQNFSWKNQYISLGKYPDIAVNKLTYEQKIVNGEVYIHRRDSVIRFEIVPSRNSTRNSQEYQTDNEQRFLERIKPIFKLKQQLIFFLKDNVNGERQLDSYQELIRLIQNKSEKKQKSILIEIPIKQDSH